MGFIELVSRIVDFDLSAGVLYYLLIQFLTNDLFQLKIQILYLGLLNSII